MSVWITLLLAIFQSPAVQEALKQLWAWVLARLEKRFGPVNDSTQGAFVADMTARLDVAHKELSWWQFGRRRIVKRMADHTKTRLMDVWNARKTGTLPTPTTETFVE